LFTAIFLAVTELVLLVCQVKRFLLLVITDTLFETSSGTPIQSTKEKLIILSDSIIPSDTGAQG